MTSPSTEECLFRRLRAGFPNLGIELHFRMLAFAAHPQGWTAGTLNVAGIEKLSAHEALEVRIRVDEWMEMAAPTLTAHLEKLLPAALARRIRLSVAMRERNWGTESFSISLAGKGCLLSAEKDARTDSLLDALRTCLERVPDWALEDAPGAPLWRGRFEQRVGTGINIKDIEVRQPDAEHAAAAVIARGHIAFGCPPQDTRLRLTDLTRVEPDPLDAQGRRLLGF